VKTLFERMSEAQRGDDPGRKLTLAEMQEQAMGPRPNPRQPIFRDHNCWKCREGELPCPSNYHNCEYPHARND